MAFAFRLERVLSVRRIQEDSARQEHAAAQEEVEAAAAAVAQLQWRLQCGLEELDQHKRSDQLSEQALYLHSLFLAGLRRGIEDAARRLAAAETAVERTGAALLEAHQAREALERLREREEKNWKKSQARREARDIDEIAVMRHRAREEEEHGP